MRTQIEARHYYPAFLQAAGEEDLNHEAIVEHDGATTLIAKIEASTPADDYFDAKVTALSEMIKHLVKEEEQPCRTFAKARQSDMDLRDLAARFDLRMSASSCPLWAV